MFEAIEMGQENILDNLISWGAELQLLNNFKRTPLSTAIMFERPRMVVKIANKLRHIARTEGRRSFTDEAESHIPTEDLGLSSILPVCCQCRTSSSCVTQAVACTVCHHCVYGACNAVDSTLKRVSPNRFTEATQKNYITKARAALIDQGERQLPERAMRDGLADLDVSASPTHGLVIEHSTAAHRLLRWPSITNLIEQTQTSKYYEFWR